MKGKLMTGLLAVILLILSVWSLFVGVIDINVASLMNGSLEQWEIFLVSGFRACWRFSALAWE